MTEPLPQASYSIYRPVKITEVMEVGSFVVGTRSNQSMANSSELTKHGGLTSKMGIVRYTSRHARRYVRSEFGPCYLKHTVCAMVFLRFCSLGCQSVDYSPRYH